jgi:hypothetical protein
MKLNLFKTSRLNKTKLPKKKNTENDEINYLSIDNHPVSSGPLLNQKAASISALSNNQTRCDDHKNKVNSIVII